MLINESSSEREAPPFSPESRPLRSGAARLIYFFTRLNPANWFNEFREFKITMEDPFPADRFSED